MTYPVRDVTGGVHRPAPAEDGCSDELSGGPFSQPSPVFAGRQCYHGFDGGCP